MLRTLSTLCLLCVLAGQARSAELTVGASGADYTSMWTALQAASAGDTVTMLPGTYPLVSTGLTPADGVVIRGQTGEPSLYIITNASADSSIIVATNALEIRDCTFTTDSAFTDGSVNPSCVCASASLTLERVVFRDIETADATACAVYINGSSSGTLTDCEFRDNHNTNASGGLVGIGMAASGTLLVEGCVFSGNNISISPLDITAASVHDGAVVRNCLFTNNRVRGSLTKAAGVKYTMVAAGDVLIDNCTFDNNEAAADAGAGQLGGLKFAGTVTARSCVFTGADSTDTFESGLVDTVSHCCSYGMEVNWFRGATAANEDTLHVDPAYLSTGSDRWDYRPTAAGVVTDAAGGYMGWINPQVSAWYAAPDANPVSADGTSTNKFNTIACIEGLSEQDTLNLATGTYEQADMVSFSSRGVTIQGVAGTRIVNTDGADDPILITCDKAKPTFSTLKFTADAPLATTTSSRGLLYCTDNADSAALVSCVFESLSRADGMRGDEGLAVSLHGEYSTVTDCDFKTIAEAGTENDTSTACALHMTGCANSTVSGCTFYDIDGNCPIKLAFGDDNVFFKNNLVVDVNCLPTNTLWPIVWCCGSPENTPDFRFNHNTFVDCANVDTLGVINLNDDTSDLFLYHSVFKNTGRVFRSALEWLSATPDADSIAYCTSFSAPFCAADDIENAGVDTLHINPRLNSTAEAATGYYQARAADCVTTGDDDYMGWEQGSALPAEGGPGRRRRH